MRHRSWEIERAVTEALKKPKLELLKDWRFRPILCEDCSTRGILGGAAMTNWTCHVCKVSQMHGSTATPNICTACAIRLFKCQRCEESLEKDLHESGE